MARRIPQEIIDDILQRTDIVEIVSEHVTLRKRGRDFKGLCPFHSEKTPSFNVNSEKQIFYCFGCHMGGNALTFLMKKGNYPFLEALELLAHRVGVSLPQGDLSPAEQEKEEQRQRWRDIHTRAAQYFREVLKRPEGRGALEYLKVRGIDDDTVRDFELGYAPRGWSGLLTEMRRQGITPQELQEAGLAVAKNRSGEFNETRESHGSTDITHREFPEATHYDRFRHRLIFAIRDIQGRVIAFGGRVLDDAVPKYLNSPETMFFSKGRCLYALDLAAQAIRAKGYALVMEGYMDVIAAHRVGCKVAVATLGTALTQEQARLLKRYTTRVCICYDSDGAGIQAAVRAGQVLAAEELDVSVIDVSPAKDPDEFLRSASVQEFETRIRAARPYLEFKFDIMMAETPARSAQEKANLIQRIAPEILKIKSAIARESMERTISQKLGVTYEALQQELFQIESKRINRKTSKKSRIQQEDFLTIQDISVRNRNTIEEIPQEGLLSDDVPPGILEAEQLILRILLEAPPDLQGQASLEGQANLINQVLQKPGADLWSLKAHRKIFQGILGAVAQLFHESPSPQEQYGGQGSHGDRMVRRLHASMATESDYEDICGRLAAVLEIEYTEGHEQEMLNDCLNRLVEAQNKEDIEKMQNEAIQLELAGDVTGAMAVLQQIGERLRRG